MLLVFRELGGKMLTKPLLLPIRVPIPMFYFLCFPTKNVRLILMTVVLLKMVLPLLKCSNIVFKSKTEKTFLSVPRNRPRVLLPFLLSVNLLNFSVVFKKSVLIAKTNASKLNYPGETPKSKKSKAVGDTVSKVRRPHVRDLSASER